MVAAVSQAYEGTLVNADWPNQSYEGLYYSSDSGVTWTLARITDGAADVQGPSDPFAVPDGNAATSVVWNPVRQLFVAAVRYHGYYQSSDGVTWTRMTNQPGAGLLTSAGLCPTNPGSTGSIACPIFRGALAVNPQTGDTFAWTVDEYNQDQGIWQDLCAASAGDCTNQTITFAQQWQTAALETNTFRLGSATIENGDYNLALAAVPSGQTTIVLAGANDLWKTQLPLLAGLRVAQYYQFDDLHERAGGRIPALAGLECGQSAGDFCGQRQRAVAFDRCHRRKRDGLRRERCHSLSESERKPGLAGRGGEHLAGGCDALHDDGRAGSQRNRRGQEHQRDNDRSGRRFWAAKAGRWLSIPRTATTGT